MAHALCVLDKTNSEYLILISFAKQNLLRESPSAARMHIYCLSCFDKSSHNFSTLSEKAWIFSIIQYPPHSIDIQGVIASKYETLMG
jgi:hypothetical protein